MIRIGLMSLETKYRGKTFLGKSKDELKNSIIKYFGNRNEQIDLDEVEIVVSKLAVKIGGPRPDDGSSLNKVHKSKLKFKDAITGAKALLRNFVGDIVSDEEIKRRSNLCYACKERVETTDCRACGFGQKLNAYVNNLKQSFGGHSIVLSPSVKGSYCNICNCALALMLPSKMDAFDESVEKQNARPIHCWLKSTSNNFRDE